MCRLGADMSQSSHRMGSFWNTCSTLEDSWLIQSVFVCVACVREELNFERDILNYLVGCCA